MNVPNHACRSTFILGLLAALATPAAGCHGVSSPGPDAALAEGVAISDVRVRFATDADFDAQTDVAGERRLPGLHVELALELLEVDAAAGALRSLEVVVLAEGADAPIASHSLEVRADSTSDVTLHVPAELVGARSSVAVEVYDLDGGHALEAPAGARWPTVGFYALTAEGDGERRGFHAPCGPVGEKTNAYCEPSWVY